MKRAIIILMIVFVLGGAYYFLSPLFNVQEVDDALPKQVAPSGFEDLTAAQQEEMLAMMEEANKWEQLMMDDATSPEIAAGAVLFPVMGTIGHPASGTVRIVETEEGAIIRYEDFETINGPRLNLYLAKDLRATEFIDLGPIRGTKGNINYTVPDGVDLSEYRYVMYWCVPFGVLFNYADLGRE